MRPAPSIDKEDIIMNINIKPLKEVAVGAIVTLLEGTSDWYIVGGYHPNGERQLNHAVTGNYVFRPDSDYACIVCEQA